jgi:hypothetical protein
MSRFDIMQAHALDFARGAAKGRNVMTRTTLTLVLAATAALAGCNKEDHTIVAGGPQIDDTNSVSNEPVALPPSVTASKSYRCKDNSLVYINWLSDGSARVKKTRDEVGTAVPAGSPSLKGDAHAATITYNGQSCKA